MSQREPTRQTPSDEEQELKYALASKADWERVCATLPGLEHELRQRNSYWDTPTRALRALGASLRLRIEESAALSRAFVTLKSGKRRSNGCFIADEIEAPIEMRDALAIHDGSLRFAALTNRVLVAVTALAIDCEQLQSWGELENLRRCYRVSPTLTVEVDHSVLCDPRVAPDRRHAEFWEVELECVDVTSARALLTRFLAAARADYKPQTMTKAERLAQFLAAGAGPS
ncbi:MAG: CYTH domain-containing protein [Planctomycetota bacterium]